MRDLGMDEATAMLRGALRIVRTRDGLRPGRLPAWVDAQMPDPALALMAQLTAGVRLAFHTDADTVELEVLETGLQIDGEARRGAVFVVTADGVPVARQSAVAGPTLAINLASAPPSVRLIAGEASVLRFGGLSSAAKTLEIWFPHTASVELRGLRVNRTADVAPAPAGGRQWVHYGSSISHGMEAKEPIGMWPAVAARAAGLELTSLGFAGQCQIDGLAARAVRDCGADLISLKLGVNIVNLDSMRERAFVPAVHAFLDTIRETRPGTPILIISPIICPLVEDHPGPTLRAEKTVRVVPRSPDLMAGALTLRRIRQLLEDIVVARRKAGDLNLHYLDGLSLFGAEDLSDLPDGLHPNNAGLQRMGERFAALAFGPDGAFAA